MDYIRKLLVRGDELEEEEEEEEEDLSAQTEKKHKQITQINFVKEHLVDTDIISPSCRFLGILEDFGQWISDELSG